MIKFENITKIYPNKVISLDHITLTIKDGEFVCLVGQSGAGKSTLLKILSAEEMPTEGHVFLSDTEVTKLPKNTFPHYAGELALYIKILNCFQGKLFLKT